MGKEDLKRERERFVRSKNKKMWNVVCVVRST